MPSEYSVVVHWTHILLVSLAVLPWLHRSDGVKVTWQREGTEMNTTTVSYYGNALKMRRDGISYAFPTIFILPEIKLPEGYLRKYFFYNEVDVNNGVVQIWRPGTPPFDMGGSNHMRLVWQHVVTGAPKGSALATLHLCRGEEFHTQDGDRIGFFNGGIACDETGLHVCHEVLNVKSLLLQVGSTYSFKPSTYASKCSVGVQIDATVSDLSTGEVDCDPVEPATTMSQLGLTTMMIIIIPVVIVILIIAIVNIMACWACHRRRRTAPANVAGMEMSVKKKLEREASSYYNAYDVMNPQEVSTSEALCRQHDCTPAIAPPENIVEYENVL